MKKLILTAIASLAFVAGQAQLVHSTTITKVKKEKQPTTWYVRAGVGIDNATGDGVQFLKDMYEDYGDDTKFVPGSVAGFELEAGFQRPIGHSGLYWGMGLGLGSRGAKYHTDYTGTDDEYDINKASVQTYALKLSPFTIGYKFAVTPDIKIDAHLGIYGSYDISGSVKSKWEYHNNGTVETFDDLEDESNPWKWFKGDVDWVEPDAGIQLGLGFWYKKFNIDFTWQRGLVFAATPSFEVFDPDAYLGSYYKEVSFYSSNFMIRVGYAF